MGKVKRTLSVVLAVAMVVTMVPQTGLTVQAQEENLTIETEAEPIVDALTSEETIEVSTEDPVDEGQAVETPEESVDDDEGGEVTGTPAEETPEITGRDDVVADNQNGDKHTVTVSGGNDGTGYTVTLPADDNGQATEGTEYKFTVTAKPYYTITSVKYAVAGGDSDQNPTSGSDGEYTISGDKITGDITITVEAAKITHTVTANYTDDVEIKSDQLTIAANGVASDAVAEGQDLTFKVALTDTAKADKYIKEVSYTVTGGEKQDKTSDVKDGICTFTIGMTEFNNDVEINVVTDNIPTYTVTFDKKNVAKVTNIKVDGNDNDPTEYPKEEDDGNWTIKAREGQKVSFKLEAAEFYKITEVKNGETVLTADKSGVYTLTVGKEDINLTVGTELDETKAYTFVFKVNGDKDSANATIDWPDDLEPKYDDDSKDLTDGKLVTRNSKVKVTINVDNKYELGDVKVGTDKLEESTETNVYVVELQAGKTVTLEAETTPKGREESATVEFDDQAGNVELTEVKVDGTAVTAEEGKYTVAAQAKRLEFTLVATGSYIPKVVDKNSKEITAVSENLDPKTNKTTYTYSVLASQIDAEEKYTITEEADMKTITFDPKGDGDYTVVQSINGRATSDDSFLRGTAVTFQVTAAENSNLKSVVVEADGKTTTPKVSSNKTSEFTVTFNANTKITVTTEGLYKASALKDYNTSDDLTPVKNVYNVSYDGKYSASVVKGSKPVALSEVTVSDSTKKPITGVGTVESGTTAVIDLQAAADTVAGQKLTVELYVEGDTKAVATYTLNVSKKISTISLPASASQAIGTVKSYKITTNGEVSRLTVEKPEGTDVVADAKIVNGALEITTGLTKGEAEVKVTTGAGEDEVSAIIKISTTALIDKNTKAPSVKLKSASDVSLNLTLGSKLSEELAKAGKDGGKVYYEVKAQAVNPDSLSRNSLGEGNLEDILKKEVVEYYERTGDSQDETVVVGISDELGKGAAWSYTVTVTLVHVANGEEPEGTSIAERIIKYDGLDSRSKEVKATCKTQNPAYETALKLKKGTTTVYTGQSNIVIATPQFSKTTTYAELDDTNPVEDITYGKESNSALTVSVDKKSGDIVATATKSTAVGKHTIQVTAAAPSGVYASKATVVINVVKGIEGLAVSVPSYSVYKAPKKAATLKATVTYNPYMTAPKTKKVTWDVVKSYSDGSETPLKPGDALYGMVTVKNGTVTVNKNYTLAADKEANTFVIKVMANDFAGNTTVGYSKEITITNEGLDLDTVAIVKYNYNEEDPKYTVVALPNGKDPVPVEASDIAWGYVRVFTGEAAKELVKGKEYSRDELEAATVSVSNLTFSSGSKKNVEVYSDGYVRVIKPANKVKLTAMANDGSKAKAELTLNIGYDTTDQVKGLRLAIYPVKIEGDGYGYYYENVDWSNPIYDFYTKKDEDEAKDSISIDLKDAGVPRFAVQVAAYTGEWWAKAPDFTNYQLTVTGGKNAYQSGANAYINVLQSDVTIKLTDKATGGKTVEYKLQNTGIAKSGAWKPTVKVANNLHKFGEQDDQKVTINLDKIDEDFTKNLGEGKTLAAKVDVDWTAMKTANQVDLLKFADAMKNDGVFEITGNNNDKKGSFELSFDSSDDGWVTFNQNSYKLKVTIGSKDQEGNFTAASTTVNNVTVKVDKTKTLTYKPTTSYTIYTKEGGALLTGKANLKDGEYVVTFDKLLNDNVNGKVKGEQNHFAETFKIEGNKLVLQVSPDQVNPNDLKGYLTYTTYSPMSYYDGPSTTNTVKITVKLNTSKAAAKYAVDGKPEIGNSAFISTTNIKVTANKEAAKLAYVAVDPTMASTWEAELPVDSDGSIIKLTAKKDLAVNTNQTVKLLIVPEDSFYKDVVKDAKDEPGEGKMTYAEAMKAYGIALSVKVKVVVYKSDLDLAKESLEAWLASVSGQKNGWLRNDLTAEALTAEINKAGIDLHGATVEVPKKVQEGGGATEEDEYAVTDPATVTGTGKIEGTLRLSKALSKDVTFELVIPAGAIGKNEINDMITNADSVKSVEIKNDSDPDTTSDVIKDKAQAAIGTGYYTVDVKEKLNITKAQDSSNKGSATITLSVTDEFNKDSSIPDITITYDNVEYVEEVVE